MDSRIVLSRRTMNLGLCGAIARIVRAEPQLRWVLCYSNREPLVSFDPYSMVILDSRYHPSLPELKKRGKQLIGYVSIGEASPDYSYFQQLRSEGLLVNQNEVWKGNYSIDIRDRRWWNLLIESIIPSILQRGFDGLFMDTLDSALYLEQQNPREFSGIAAAAKDLIATLRQRFPHMPLAMNRGYPLLEDIGSKLDAVLGESVYTTYDFSKKEYVPVKQTDYKEQVRLLQQAAVRNSRLKVLTLDYWNSSDPEGIRRIYRRERANGFAPYVSSIDLQRVIQEP